MEVGMGDFQSVAVSMTRRHVNMMLRGNLKLEDD